MKPTATDFIGLSPKCQERYGAIMEAAARVFLANGFQHASMDAIAKEANIAKQTLYNNFGNKETLFRAIIRNRCEHLMTTALLAEDVNNRSVKDTLMAFGTSLIRNLLEPSALAVHRIVMAESRRFPRLGQIYYEAGPQYGRQVLRDYLARQVEAGRLQIDNIELAADHFAGGIFCPAQQRAMALNQIPSEDEIQQRVSFAVNQFIKLYGTERE